MLQLLYYVICVEMIVTLSLVFKTTAPIIIRRLVIVTLDRMKRGRGLVVVKTVVGTLAVVLCSSIYSMFKIQRRRRNTLLEAGGVVVNSTDQVLMSKHILEASLLGFVLFLSLMIDRLHHYIREHQRLRKTIATTKKQSRIFDDGKRALTEEVATLMARVKKLESECEVKGSKVKALEANLEALKNQSEGFLLEYDRILGDNQNLRRQLKSIE
ncbi:hypothetical protein RIF29_27422 [Crotalaria pallida]|uniref:Endoplasmic reticulum transmembrane protein n=1 Tax=Crotalaria pallida TaxID=3830 RepID=A0AAN9EPZ0_CROPI